MNLYMDFIPGMATEGVIRGPAGDGKVSAILRDDVAAAAAAVLNGAFDGQTFDLTGPSAFSLAEAAALMGAAYVDETDEEAYASRAGYGAPDWEVQGWVTSYQAIRDGSLSAVSPHVRELTGRDPRSLADPTFRPRSAPGRGRGPWRPRPRGPSAGRWSPGARAVRGWRRRRPSTAASKASWFACDGLVEPLILRTYCSGGVVDLVGGGGRLEVMELADVAAHAA